VTIETKDPYECPECGTVNAWNQEKCRSCGTVRIEDSPNEKTFESADADTPDMLENIQINSEPINVASTPSQAPRRRWNAFWIFLGIAIHVVSIHLGVFSIIKVFIEPDPALKATIEKTLEIAKTGDAEKAAVLDNLPKETKSKLSTIRTILISLLIIVPLLIGAATGFFCRSILEGAASMGLSAVLIPVLNGAAEFAILWGPINAGIGALGAYAGYRLAVRFKPTSPESANH
jgi:hypothetical protein